MEEQNKRRERVFYDFVLNKELKKDEEKENESRNKV